MFGVACQKDYYLGDLEAANRRISMLEADKSSLENRIADITSVNSDLESQLRVVMQQYEDGLMSLEEANELIDQLELELANQIGVQDGIYQVNSGLSGSWSWYIEIANEEYIRRGYSNPHDSIPFFRWTGATNASNVNISIIGIDMLNVSYTASAGHEYEREDVLEVELVDEIPLDYSPQEWLDILIENEAGIYSDPVYRNIVPWDVRTYWDAFIADGERHGVDMSDFNYNNLTFRVQETHSGAIATGGGSCDRSAHRVTVNPVTWELMAKHNPWDPGALRIMYHEFGHALFQMHHLCQEGHIMTGRHQNPKVIFSEDECESEYIRLRWDTGEWDRAVDDLFGFVWYDTWCDDHTGKVTTKIWED